MTKPSLYQFYLYLIPNLIRELYFFIPEEEILMVPKDKMDAFKKHIALNEIYVFDYHKGPVPYTEDRNTTEILAKANKLEANLFSLKEKQDGTNEEGFNYVLGKYFKMVETLIYFSDWMYRHLNKYTVTTKEVEDKFYFQYLNFKNHSEYLEQEFHQNMVSDPKNNFDKSDIIDACFEDVSNSFDAVKLTRPTKPDSLTRSKDDILKTDEKQVEKPKPPLVTEAEAERLLLEKYFNIEK
ncbi:hypothetical protein [Seonamhaeicola aphaedonensis]|uniref:Uncharacterized protein n=1 Tax=Seonamhaeicola aphaedonensis TaxID=1461338 RepID=A0A3D9HDS0_9FLAO|nr:hypothetical protein [Seonamhaeicola aphaedonensis]RED47624.1 hypothetical protein DFQ02_106253 [Seonamhaeicola aphaedonensis]